MKIHKTKGAIRSLLLMLVFAFGIVSILGSLGSSGSNKTSNNDGGMDNGTDGGDGGNGEDPMDPGGPQNFLWELEYLLTGGSPTGAWIKFADKWKRISLTPGIGTLSFENATGNFDLAVLGNDGDEMTGTLISGNADEFFDLKLSYTFDDTVLKANYLVDGTVSNNVTEPEAYFGRLSWKIPTGQFAINIEQDADDETIGDFYISAMHPTGIHYKYYGNYDISSNQSLDANFVASDLGNTFTVDATAAINADRYQFLRAWYQSSLRTRILLGENSADDMPVFLGLPGSATPMGGAYKVTTFAGYEDSQNQVEYKSAVRHYKTDPTKFAIKGVANLLDGSEPESGSDTDFTWKASFKADYSFGLGADFKVDYLRGRLDSGTVDWNVYVLPSRFESDRFSIGFPVDLTMADGFSASWAPDETNVKDYGALGSNWGLEASLKLAHLVESDDKPADNDNLVYARSILSVSF